MPDPVSFITIGLNALKTAETTVKALRPWFKEIRDEGIKNQIIEMGEQILEARSALLDAKENLDLKDATIKELIQKLRLAQELQFKEPFYYKTDDATPFCPRCWEIEQKAVHLSPEEQEIYIKNRTCPQCKSKYKTGDVPPIMPRMISGNRNRSIY